MLLKHQRKLFQTKEASSRIPWTSSRTSWLNFVDWIFFIYFVFLSVFCNTCIHWVQIHLCVRRCECVNPLSGVTAVRMCDIIAPSRIKVSARRRHTDTDWSWDETGQTPVIVKKRKKKAFMTCSETDNQLLWLEKNSWIDRTTSRIFYLTLIFVGIFLRNCLSVSSASLLS